MTAGAIVFVTMWLTIVHLLAIKGLIHFLNREFL